MTTLKSFPQTHALVLLVLLVALVLVPLVADVVDEAHSAHQKWPLLLRFPSLHLRAHLILQLYADGKQNRSDFTNTTECTGTEHSREEVGFQTSSVPSALSGDHHRG